MRKAEYTVVEVVCEECGVVNDHYTTHCPFARRPPIEPVSLRVGLPLDRVITAMITTPDTSAVWIPRR